MPVYAGMRVEMNGLHKEQHTHSTLFQGSSLDPGAAEAREENKGQWAFETLKSIDDKNTHTLFLWLVMYVPSPFILLVLNSDGLQTCKAL